MFSFLVGAVLGSFVAWSVPQPQWAKNVQAKVASWFVKKVV